MTRLDRAIKLAVEVHSGQVDKGNNPYILHPLRVMLAIEKDLRNASGYKEDYLCTAILHDVIEDYQNSDYNIDEVCDLVHECGDKVYLEVMFLTRAQESWNKYIRRVFENPIARHVKIKDLEDNCDLSRLNRFYLESDEKNRDRYMRAKKYLETGTGKL